MGTARAQLVRRAREAGDAVVPALLRGFTSESNSEASWAEYLLARIGGARVVRGLSALLVDTAASEAVKERAAQLMAALATPSGSTRVRDPRAALRHSVGELLRGLDGDDDLRQTAELILVQVPAAELEPLAEELDRHGSPRARRLLDALMASAANVSEAKRALERVRGRAGDERLEEAVESLLDRGLGFLEAGRPRAALKRLRRFVADHPSDPEGRSALGVCLLELDKTAAALPHLRAAARLDPKEGLHHWNLASAARQAGRMGGCYLELRTYLELGDSGDGSQERRAEARSFARGYERALDASHKGPSLRDTLRGEEQFARAYAALSEGHHAESARGFESVLALAPRHYPSWGHLGTVYLGLRRKREAMRCFEHALELNPQYRVARINLAMLDS